jgi:signal transduction histidine kinase
MVMKASPDNGSMAGGERLAPIVVLGLEGEDLDVIESVLTGYSVFVVSGMNMLRQLLLQHKPLMVISGIWIKDGHILEVMDILSEACPHAGVAVVVSSVDEDMVAQVQRSNDVLVFQRPLRSLELSAAVAYVVDVAELKERCANQSVRVEHLEAANEDVSRLKSEFLSLISHELRTPLTEVQGYAELLDDLLTGHSDREVLDYTKAILRGADQLKTLIEDLMTLSKAEANAISLDNTSFPAYQLVGDDVGAFLEEARELGYETHVRIDERAGILIADKTKLMKVLLNLLSNAVKFTPHGGKVGIEISDAGSAVLCKVWDTGKGIKQDRLREIFEAFRQEDSSDRRNRGGLGIGLSLVKHFVSLHGGSLRVTSQPETGTTFSFLIPRDGSKRTGPPGRVESPTRSG